MKKFIGSEVSWNGIETRYFYNSADKKIHVQRIQDVEPQIDVNKAEYNAHGDHKPSRYGKGPMHKIATIPPAVVEKWLKEGFNVFTATDAEMRRKLNDPDYKRLRTMPGKL